MDNKTLVVGAFALAIGLLLGMLVAPSGPGIAEIRKAMNEELAAAGEKTAALDAKLGTMADQVGALSEKVGAIQTSAADLAAKVGADAAGAGGDLDALAEACLSLEVETTSEAGASRELEFQCPDWGAGVPAWDRSFGFFMP